MRDEQYKDYPAEIAVETRKVVLHFPCRIEQTGPSEITIAVQEFQGPVFSPEYCAHLEKQLGQAEADRVIDETAHQLWRKELFAKVR